jgi:hypothetical protein
LSLFEEELRQIYLEVNEKDKKIFDLEKKELELKH